MFGRKEDLGVETLERSNDLTHRSVDEGVVSVHEQNDGPAVVFVLVEFLSQEPNLLTEPSPWLTHSKHLELKLVDLGGSTKSLQSHRFFRGNRDHQ